MATVKQRREKLENFICEIDDAIGVLDNFKREAEGLWAELKLAAKTEPEIGKFKSLKIDPIIDELYQVQSCVEMALCDLPEDESEDDDEEAEEEPALAMQHDVGEEPAEG